MSDWANLFMSKSPIEFSLGILLKFAYVLFIATPPCTWPPDWRIYSKRS